MLRKQLKIFVVQKVKVQLITVNQPDGSRNFAEFEKTSTIRQG